MKHNQKLLLAPLIIIIKKKKMKQSSVMQRSVGVEPYSPASRKLIPLHVYTAIRA